MTAIILFAILLVLIYAVGLLPGVMKVIAGVVAAIVVAMIAGKYGWPIVIGGGVAVVAIVILSLHFATRPKDPLKLTRASRENIDSQLVRINRQQQAKRQEQSSAKEEAMRRQRESTDSIGKH